MGLISKRKDIEEEYDEFLQKFDIEGFNKKEKIEEKGEREE